VLHYGGTVRSQAQHHEECPIGASISHLLYTGGRARVGMSHAGSDAPRIPHGPRRMSHRAAAEHFGPLLPRTARDHLQFPRLLSFWSAGWITIRVVLRGAQRAHRIDARTPDSNAQ